MSEGALQIAVKRREAKDKREKERHTYLNAEFQRVARKDKKAFLSDQCKEKEENNRMEKARDLVKKIRDTKGIFHVQMGSIKDRNYMDQDFPVTQMVKNLPAMQETRVRSLGWEVRLEKEMAIHSSIPGESHGQRSLAGYSLWSGKESDVTEQLTQSNTG